MGLFDNFRKSALAAEVHDPAEDYDRTPSQNITVNLTETASELNGKSYTFPIQLTELVELFGEPEKSVFGKMYIDVLSDKQNAYLNQTTPQRLNFVWHELGIKAYCYDRVSIRAMQFQLRPYTYREMPTASHFNMFGGDAHAERATLVPADEAGKAGVLRQLQQELQVRRTQDTWGFHQSPNEGQAAHRKGLHQH